MQLSDVLRSHDLQDNPFVPHACIVEGIVHIPSEQQPFGQDTASQMQAPLTQCRLALQAVPEPQEHTPLVEQLSARIESHMTHADPKTPQAILECPLQVGPEQQPAAHVIAHPLHVPFVQVSPFGQP